jgi:hypothetical protein
MGGPPAWARAEHCADTLDRGYACAEPRAKFRGIGEDRVAHRDGSPDSGSFCSDECATSSQCTGMLPLCSDVAFVGRICIRTPPP